MYRSEELLVIAKRMQDAGLLTKGVTREQLIDFAYGNTSIENPKITRALAEKAVESITQKCERCNGYGYASGCLCELCKGSGLNKITLIPPSRTK